MNDSLRTAEFVASKRGNIFVLAHHGQNFGGKCTLLVPPFAEEMNKSRRIIAFLGNRLAENGRGLVVPDLYGTGDSDGDFADTDCDAWFDDLRATENWARSKGWSIDSAVGIRLGGLLALLYSEYRRAAFCRIVLWQPSLDGKRTLEQFLRLRVAASMTAGNTETVAQLKSRIAGGEIIEVAGYELSPRLAEQMETLNLPDRFEFGAKYGKMPPWLIEL